MTIATAWTRPFALEDGQRLDLAGLTFDQYRVIADAMPEPRRIKMLYLDGTLTILTTSRSQAWLGDRLREFVREVAFQCGLIGESAGRSTFRRESLEAGIEGDQTFWFGDHSRVMRGPVNIDLETQPPPDLAIEVEETQAADQAMAIWGRLGVPEVWRFDMNERALTFWLRGDDASYVQSPVSAGLPMISAEDVQSRMRLAEELMSSEWHAGLGNWVRDVLVPRQAGGA